MAEVVLDTPKMLVLVLELVLVLVLVLALVGCTPIHDPL